jgi:uncharacterized protein YdeI (YjbR/CyaY-like superfamily)
MDVKFFRSSDEFRAWLEENHAKAQELWLGFFKKSAPEKGIIYQEAVDQALCFGWIDGVRKRLDEAGYTIRLTPRKPRSIWSAVNIKRFGELAELGWVRPPGLHAFDARDQKRSGLYLTSKEAAGWTTAIKSKWKQTRKPGGSSRRSRPGIKGRPVGGS